MEVSDTVGLHEETEEPDEQVGDRHSGDDDHPEPEERVDLLRVHVDGQYALHTVALHIAWKTNKTPRSYDLLRAEKCASGNADQPTRRRFCSP